MTKRYVSNYMTTTRKVRFEEKWISAVLDKFNDQQDTKVGSSSALDKVNNGRE